MLVFLAPKNLPDEISSLLSSVMLTREFVGRLQTPFSFSFHQIVVRSYSILQENQDYHLKALIERHYELITQQLANPYAPLWFRKMYEHREMLGPFPFLP
jgi:hypothetical protein